MYCGENVSERTFCRGFAAITYCGENVFEAEMIFKRNYLLETFVRVEFCQRTSFKVKTNLRIKTKPVTVGPDRNAVCPVSGPDMFR